MEDYIKAFVEFLTKIFSALALFLGWTVPVEELETTTGEATTAEATTAEATTV